MTRRIRQMANFGYAIKKTLKHEGGYNEVKGDSGGATNFGISLQFLQGYVETAGWVDIDGSGFVDSSDIKNLTENQAKKIYYEEFWLKNKCHFIDNDEVAAKVFDMAVNMGSKQAIKLLQQAINHMGADLKIDGMIGNATVTAANKLEGHILAVLLRYECIIFYQNLVKSKPDYMKFLKGWMNRAVS